MTARSATALVLGFATRTNAYMIALLAVAQESYENI